MTERESIQLERLPRLPSTPSHVGTLPDAEREPLDASSLHPVDTGFHAYAYLASAFILEMLCWSFPFSYGVFLSYYNKKFHETTSLLPLVGNLASGIMYLNSPVVFLLSTRHPRQRKRMLIFGLAMSVTGLAAAAFATKPWQLVLTQGIIYGIGGNILYFTAAIHLFEWFQAKRGLAQGVIFAGSGLGGVIMPIFIDVLLTKYGQRTTLLAMAALLAASVIPTFPYIKPRTPAAQSTATPSINWSFLRSGPFYILFIGNFLQGLGNFIPGTYLPTFFSDNNLGTTAGTLAVSLMNASSVPGNIFLGWATDRYDLRLVLTFSTVGSALSVFLLWGMSTSLPPLLAFSVVFGFCAGGFSAMWPRIVSIVAKDDPHLSSTLWTLFIACRGVGNVLSAPISSSLMKHSFVGGALHLGYTSEGFGALIVFTGVALLASTVGVGYNLLAKGEDRRPGQSHERTSG